MAVTVTSKNPLKNVEGAVKRKSWAYDLECYPNFFSASFEHLTSDERREFIIYADLHDKKYSINDYLALIHFVNAEVHTLVGYNNQGYDDLLMKHLLLSVDFMKHAGVSEIVKSCKSLNDKIISRQEKKFAKGGKQLPPQKDKYLDSLKARKLFNSIDLILQFNTINRVSLKQIAINMRWPEVIDLPFPPDHIVLKEQVHGVLSSGKDGIMYYNRNDTAITKALFYMRKPELQERLDYGKAQDANIINANDTNIAKYIIRKYYAEVTKKKPDEFTNEKCRTFYKAIQLGDCFSRKINFITKPYQLAMNAFKNAMINPNKMDDELKGIMVDSTGHTVSYKKKEPKKKQFEYILRTKYLTHTLGIGGIHSNNLAEILEEDADHWLIDIDVKSYYPSIIINEKLFPKHLGPEFIKVYRDKIYYPRLELKAEGNSTAAEMLKKALNSTFGLTKSVYSWLYDPKMTLSITVSGQLYIMMLMERLEARTGCTVVYSNTDGLTVRVPKTEYDAFTLICKQWEESTRFELEYVKYKKMIIKDVNNFLMITHDTKKPIKVKGDFVNSWVDRQPNWISSGYVFPIVPMALQAYYIDGTDPQFFVKKHTNIYDFLKAERTNPEKFDIRFHKLVTPDDAEHLHKNNRWIITQKNPDEGKLVKFSYKRKQITQMQKGRYVVMLNDLSSPHEDIGAYRLDYDFYLKEIFNIIRQVKKKRDHTPPPVQMSIV
jgi:hypothetical protein